MSIFTQRIRGSGCPAAEAAERTFNVVVEREERAPMAMRDAPAWAKEMAIARPRPGEWEGGVSERGKVFHSKRRKGEWG